MNSLIKKIVVVLVVCVVLTHFTDINFTGMIASKIDELSNSTYATEFIENVQDKADYLIDNLKIRMMKKNDDSVSFEVTVGVPDTSQEISSETTMNSQNTESNEITTSEINDSTYRDEQTSDKITDNNSTENDTEKIRRILHILKDVGQVVLDDAEN